MNSNIKSTSDTGIFKSRVGYFKYFMLIILINLLYSSLSELSLSLDSHIVTTYSSFFVLKEGLTHVLRPWRHQRCMQRPHYRVFLAFRQDLSSKWCRHSCTDILNVLKSRKSGCIKQGFVDSLAKIKALLYTPNYRRQTLRRCILSSAATQ